MIIKRQINDDEKFKIALNDARLFISILKEKNEKLDFLFELDPIFMNQSNMIKFKNLMDNELIENPNEFELFASILEDYYYKFKLEEKETSKQIGEQEKEKESPYARD